MDFSWKIAIDAGFISIALLLATFLRAKVRFFQKYLIPNALTAGFLLLPFYNFAMPALGYATNRLGELVYHLLNISFIAMSLRSSPPKIKGHKGGGVLGMATGILSGYAFQTLLGLGVTLFFLPKVFPSFGLFLPLGYAAGPGQAFSIGKTWEGMGFQGASSVGLTIASIGYLWGCFGGIVLVNIGRRRKWLSGPGLAALTDRSILSGLVSRDVDRPIGARQTTDPDSIDSFSFHVAVVLFTYLLSFFFLKLVTFGLAFAGQSGKDLASALWGLNFVFSAIIAIVMRRLIEATKLDYLLDDDSLSRLTGVSVDFMLAGSVAAISLGFILMYWLPILIITTLGGLMVFVITPWMCSRMFHDNHFERMLMIYGVNTGTLSTGLALLRVTDPEYKSSVASDYMLSAGLSFVMALPFVMTINWPAYAATKQDMNWYWAEFGIAAAYLITVVVLYLVLAGKRAFAKPGKIWYTE